MRNRLTAISFGLAIAAAIYLLVGPAYRGAGRGGVTHRTLLQVNGWWAIVPVMFPVLVALVPRRQAVQLS